MLILLNSLLLSINKLDKLSYNKVKWDKSLF